MKFKLYILLIIIYINYEKNELIRINHYWKAVIKDSMYFFIDIYKRFNSFEIKLEDLMEFCNNNKLQYKIYCRLLLINKINYFNTLLILINNFLKDLKINNNNICLILFNIFNDNTDKFLTFIDIKFLYINQVNKISKLILKDLFIKILKYNSNDNLKVYFNIDKEVISYNGFINYCNNIISNFK